MRQSLRNKIKIKRTDSVESTTLAIRFLSFQTFFHSSFVYSLWFNEIRWPSRIHFDLVPSTAFGARLIWRKMTDFIFCLPIEFKISLPTQGGFEVHPMKILRFSFVCVCVKCVTFSQVHTNVLFYISIYPYSAQKNIISLSHEENRRTEERKDWMYYTLFQFIHYIANAFANFRISSRQMSHAGLIFIGSPTSHSE